MKILLDSLYSIVDYTLLYLISTQVFGYTPRKKTTILFGFTALACIYYVIALESSDLVMLFISQLCSLFAILVLLFKYDYLDALILTISNIFVSGVIQTLIISLLMIFDHSSIIETNRPLYLSIVFLISISILMLIKRGRLVLADLGGRDNE